MALNPLSHKGLSMAIFVNKFGANLFSKHAFAA